MRSDRTRHLFTSYTLCSLILVYAVSRILQVFPGPVPMLGVVALHVLPPVIFAVIHGALLYRWRGILVFLGTCLVVGNGFENLGVLTGFPYGRYYFTDLMGPKLFLVPILLGLAYVGMAYLSWILASLIMGNISRPLTGLRVVTLPLIAAFLMVAWDFSMDAIWGTILQGWIWRDGGAYFGVPVSNFFGWYLTVYIFYQTFAVYLRGRETNTATLTPGYWRLALIFYGMSAAGNVLLCFPRLGPSIVYDPSGAAWRVSAITGTCALVSVFVMGAFTLMAWARLAESDASAK
jgi:putative membrane protein